MTTTQKKSLKARYIELDNRLTYIVGYRNLFNIAVMFVASWFIIVTESEFAATARPTVYAAAFILLILGMKWFLMQIRDNIDATAVHDVLDEGDGQ